MPLLLDVSDGLAAGTLPVALSFTNRPSSASFLTLHDVHILKQDLIRIGLLQCCGVSEARIDG